MRKAIVSGGFVINVVIGDAPGAVECPDDCNIGWAYDGSTFTAPTPSAVAASVPLIVTKIQTVRALRAAGLWDGLTGMKAAIAASPVAVQEDWEYSTMIPRNDPTVAAFAASASLSGAQVDALFIAAASL